MSGWTGPLTPAQAAEIAAIKRVICKGFKAALLAGASKQKGGNPTTPAAILEEILPDLDQVLVMTVNSGLGHQHFVQSILAKIRRVSPLNEHLNPAVS